MDYYNGRRTAVQFNDTWYISRGRWTFFRLWWVYREDEVSRFWWTIRTREEWIVALLSRRDCRILRRAQKQGVLSEVWAELNKVRTEQYKAFLAREEDHKEEAKNRLIMEVHRAN